MKIIEAGTSYKIYGEDLIVLDKLPAQTYRIGFGQFTGFFLEKQHNMEIKEDKIYGVHKEKCEKVFNRFEKFKKNLGIILSGDKGIGKSLFARLLAQAAIKNGIPVILVNEYIPGIDDFINEIEGEILVLFDEFDKTFAKTKDGDPQSKLLSLFDGTGTGKKMFVITCNRYDDLNEYLLNRPGRFLYHFRFEYPTADEVEEYLKDKLDEKYYDEIKKVIAFSRKIKLNFDCLAAIAFELNEGEKFEDAIKDMNIVNTSDSSSRYDIKLFTVEGFVFTFEKYCLDMFSRDEQRTDLYDDKNNCVEARFKPCDAEFDMTTRTFVVPQSKFGMRFYDTDIEEELRETYKKLHYDHLEITLNYGSRLHYTV